MGIYSQDLIPFPTVILDKPHHLFGSKLSWGTLYRYQSYFQGEVPTPSCYFFRKYRQAMSRSHSILSVHISLWSVIVRGIQNANLPLTNSSVAFQILAPMLEPSDPCLLQIGKRVLTSSTADACIETRAAISPDWAQNQPEWGGNTWTYSQCIQDIHQHLAAGVERFHYTLTQIEYNVFRGIYTHNTSSIPLDGCLGGEGFYLLFLLFSVILNNLV